MSESQQEQHTKEPNPIDFSYWNLKAVYETSILILLKEQKKKHEKKASDYY